MNKLALVDKAEAPRRRDDAGRQTWYRSDRMINDNGQWYFCTRESTIEGPFETKADAALGLRKYIRLKQLEAGIVEDTPLEGRNVGKKPVNIDPGLSLIDLD